MDVFCFPQPLFFIFLLFYTTKHFFVFYFFHFYRESVSLTNLSVSSFCVSSHSVKIFYAFIHAFIPIPRFLSYTFFTYIRHLYCYTCVYWITLEILGCFYILKAHWWKDNTNYMQKGAYNEQHEYFHKICILYLYIIILISIQHKHTISV